MYSKQENAGVKGKMGTHYGAHQHFIVSTRKNRLAEFGVTCIPCELDITKFVTPEQLMILENKGRERSLARFQDHDTMQVVTLEGPHDLVKIESKIRRVKKV